MEANCVYRKLKLNLLAIIQNEKTQPINNSTNRSGNNRVRCSEGGTTENESDLQFEDNIHIIDRCGISSDSNVNLYTSFIYI
jgi:hypothetical protein